MCGLQDDGDLENSSSSCTQAGLGTGEREEARSLVRRCFPGLGMSNEDLDKDSVVQDGNGHNGHHGLFKHVKGIFVFCFGCGLHFRTESPWIFELI